MSFLARRLAVRCIHNVMSKRNMSAGVANPRQTAIEQRRTLDDLPAPLGPYAEVYQAKQTKMNLNVLLSIAFLVGLMVAAVNMKVWIFPDKSVPLNIEDYYRPENDMRIATKNVYIEVVEKEED